MNKKFLNVNDCTLPGDLIIARYYTYMVLSTNLYVTALTNDNIIWHSTLPAYEYFDVGDVVIRDGKQYEVQNNG